jgi:hypothetical protein
MTGYDPVDRPGRSVTVLSREGPAGILGNYRPRATRRRWWLERFFEFASVTSSSRSDNFPHIGGLYSRAVLFAGVTSSNPHLRRWNGAG